MLADLPREWRLTVCMATESHCGTSTNSDREQQQCSVKAQEPDAEGRVVSFDSCGRRWMPLVEDDHAPFHEQRGANVDRHRHSIWAARQQMPHRQTC